MPGEILKVDFGVTLSGGYNPVELKPRDDGGAEQYEKKQRHQGDYELEVPLRGISQFGEKTHSLVSSVKRCCSQPAKSRETGQRTLGLAHVNTIVRAPRSASDMNVSEMHSARLYGKRVSARCRLHPGNPLHADCRSEATNIQAA